MRVLSLADARSAPSLHSESARIGPSVRDRLEPALQSLLDAARRTGAIHSELDAKGVITALALLCHPVPDEGVDFNRRLIAVFLNGLRVP